MLKIKKQQDFDVVDDDWFGGIPRINLGHLYARQELYHQALPPTLRLSFYMAAGDPNLDPHVYVAGSLLTEPSPQPHTDVVFYDLWRYAVLALIFPMRLLFRLHRF